MHRIIVANRRGHQVVEWETTDTEEARASIAEAERILREARDRGCAVSRTGRARAGSGRQHGRRGSGSCGGCCSGGGHGGHG